MKPNHFHVHICDLQSAGTAASLKCAKMAQLFTSLDEALGNGTTLS